MRHPVRDAYASIAERYIELFGSTGAMHPDDLAMIQRHLTNRTGVVLDAGCGPGHLTAHLGSCGVASLGIDLVAEFLEHAATAGPSGRYAAASIDALPFRDESVHGVLAWYSLIHLDPGELDAVLSELRRVLTTAREHTPRSPPPARDPPARAANRSDGFLRTRCSNRL